MHLRARSGRGNKKFSGTLHTPLAEPPLSYFLNPPLYHTYIHELRMTDCDIMTKSFLYIISNLKIWLTNVASFPQTIQD